MLIGMDASRAFVKNRTGIEEYSYQVIKHLRDKLDGHEVVLYLRRGTWNIKHKTKTILKSSGEKLELPENWKIKIIKWPKLWTQIGLSLEMFLYPVDILFIPAHTIPIIHPRKTIVTLHGLEYEFCPKAYSWWERFYMRRVIKNSCRWASKIISVSKNTKKDLINLYKVPKEKIRVVYEGYDCKKTQIQNNKFKIISKFKIQNSKFLFFIGRLEERKNISGIIKAFEILKEKYNIPHKLVLAGGKGYGFKNAKIKMQKSKYRKDIILTGYISDEEKWKLLKKAEVFLFPTFYEGFGLPILEAQSVGTPVVASGNSSILEIAPNNSVLLIDPHNSKEITEAVYKFISDKDLRNDIIKKGYKNIERFSWEKCAGEIAEILKR